MYKLENGQLVPLNGAELEALEALKIEGEKNAAAFRLQEAITERNKRLADCDWTQLPDVPLSDARKLAWQEYRQALRDITEQPEWPNNIAWPTPPSNEQPAP